MEGNDDKRLIEDFLPLREINKESLEEKSARRKDVKKGHISKLHLYWARRPLVACRSAVYASLVPAPKGKKGRGPKSAFLKKLCVYPPPSDTLKKATRHIYDAHAKRLSKERGYEILPKDIREGKAPKPRILDMFAGGGSIPLEVSRLGCEAHGLELNPLAHLIELATLVYPQKYGDKLVKAVEKWGLWVIERARREVGDLYPTLTRNGSSLSPVAYIWTRIVRCKNPSCGAAVPLVRQTWLRKKKGKYIALRVSPRPPSEKTGSPPKNKEPLFTVVSSASETEKEATERFGFDPGRFSRRGNAPCVYCGTVATIDYVKREGLEKRIDHQLMAVVCAGDGKRGKTYVSVDETEENPVPDEKKIGDRIRILCEETGLSLPEEEIVPHDAQRCIAYGYTTFQSLFTPRQLLTLLTLTKWVRLAHREMMNEEEDEEFVKGTMCCLGCAVSRFIDNSSSLCMWRIDEIIGHTFGRQVLPMVWDFAEINPFGKLMANINASLRGVLNVLKEIAKTGCPVHLIRGSATELPHGDRFFDAIITDPPYYDNISYAALSDFFYVWLKRLIGPLYAEHLSEALTPKSEEVVADAKRFDSRREARRFYEEMMFRCLKEGFRVLKDGALLVLVYAHKTATGWSALVEALRRAGFVIQEAWPVHTERPGRLRELGSSALASSVFLIARKKEKIPIGSFEKDVHPLLVETLREKVNTYFKEGLTGANLLITCVGTGLKTYTRFEKVEGTGGEEVTTRDFLGMVERIVQEILLEKLFGTSGSPVSDVDGPTRFYVLWRYAYGTAEIDSGEATLFSDSLGTGFDDRTGPAAGRNPLLEKKGGKYGLRDYSERGREEGDGTGGNVATIDALHRILWLQENQAHAIPDYLAGSKPDPETLRLAVQALAGTTLAGNRDIIKTTPREKRALSLLLANWKRIMTG